MGKTDEILERCLECRLCVDNCEFLKSHCETPKNLAEEFRARFAEIPAVPYSCNLCGLCGRLCPEGLDIGQVCLEVRRQLVTAGLSPLPEHQAAIKEQEWSSPDIFSAAAPGPGDGKCKQIFFPGCSLSAYSPDLVIKTYEYLQERLPCTGIMLGCCGAPSYELGDSSRFQQALGKITARMKEAGASELIVACPDCYHIFKENAPDIRLTTVYELMVRNGLPEPAKTGNGRIFSIHDSCKTRYESGIQESVRKIAAELGYVVEEPEYTKDKTRCCGMGGMVAYVDMKLVNRTTMGRVKELPHDVLTYCASCRNAFALTGKPSVHILDIIFGSELEKTRRKSPVIGAARRKNQSELKARLTGEPAG